MAAQNGTYVAELTAAAGAGGVLSLANPEGADIIVTRLVLDVQTESDAACTLDAGIAADGTTSADDLIDGISVGAAGPKDNIDDQGSNGESKQVWGSGQYLTVSEASGAVAGLVGQAYVEYVRRVT